MYGSKKSGVDQGFKSCYGGKEPSAREESAHVSKMASKVSQRPDSIPSMKKKGK